MIELSNKFIVKLNLECSKIRIELNRKVICINTRLIMLSHHSIDQQMFEYDWGRVKVSSYRNYVLTLNKAKAFNGKLNGIGEVTSA